MIHGISLSSPPDSWTHYPDKHFHFVPTTSRHPVDTLFPADEEGKYVVRSNFMAREPPARVWQPRGSLLTGVDHPVVIQPMVNVISAAIQRRYPVLLNGAIEGNALLEARKSSQNVAAGAGSSSGPTGRKTVGAGEEGRAISATPSSTTPAAPTNVDSDEDEDHLLDAKIAGERKQLHRTALAWAKILRLLDRSAKLFRRWEISKVTERTGAAPDNSQTIGRLFPPPKTATQPEFPPTALKPEYFHLPELPQNLYIHQDAIRQLHDLPLVMALPLYDYVVSNSVRLFGTFVENELQFYMGMMVPGEAFFDVGANVGTYAVAMAKYLGVGGEPVFPAGQEEPANWDAVEEEAAAGEKGGVEEGGRTAGDGGPPTRKGGPKGDGKRSEGKPQQTPGSTPVNVKVKTSRQLSTERAIGRNFDPRITERRLGFDKPDEPPGSGRISPKFRRIRNNYSSTYYQNLNHPRPKGYSGVLTAPVDLSPAYAPGFVVAFEPFRLLYQKLCANAAVNGLENMYAYNYGLGDKEFSLKNLAAPDMRKLVYHQMDISAEREVGFLSKRRFGGAGVRKNQGCFYHHLHGDGEQQFVADFCGGRDMICIEIAL